MTTADTLYHYCSTEAFVSIVRSRSLRLSSLRLSNDTMEGRLVNATIMRLAMRDDLDAAARESLQESLAFMERFFDGLGFCLSEDGDLLSQWRGYADDARGVSIGFARPYLSSLADSSRGQSQSGFALYEVEYDPSEHEALVEPTYRELRKLMDAGAFKMRGSWSLLDTRTPEEVAADDKTIEQVHNALFRKVLGLFPRLYELKASAFREEREWRLVSIFTDTTSDECEFRAAKGRVIPYRTFSLESLSTAPIVEVVVGPRHETPPDVVKSLLRQAGFGEASVRRSEATYR
jgi:Protein of unknown function (DUF2971)